jgi:hypothetical protein
MEPTFGVSDVSATTYNRVKEQITDANHNSQSEKHGALMYDELL